MGKKQSKIDFEREIANILKTKRRYFWDKGPLNYRRDKYIIIERVLEFGTEVEVDVIQNYYGIEAVKSVVKESRGLSPRTVNYFSLCLYPTRNAFISFTKFSISDRLFLMIRYNS